MVRGSFLRSRRRTVLCSRRRRRVPFGCE
jgi:hypothetical protein